MIGRGQLERGGKRGRVVGQPRVVVQALQVLDRAGGRLPRQLRLAVGERGDAVREHRRRAAEMGDLQADLRVAFQRAAVDEVGERAYRVERELVQPHGVPERQLVGREAGMDEDVRAAAVELGQHRLERRVAEVDAGDVGEQHHAVERQLVEREGQLGQRGVDVGQRQRGQPGEARVAGDLGDPLVGDPRQRGLPEARPAGRSR